MTRKKPTGDAVRAATAESASPEFRDGTASAENEKPQISMVEFMAQAWAMEMEAIQRYGELADAMEAHNNLGVAAMFRKMAQYEGKHADQLAAEMGWTEPPMMARSHFAWPSFEAPETVPFDELHYLMQPQHALELALAAEERAERFFAELARVATDPSVKRAALELQSEEREHVALVKDWMKKLGEPDRDWATDPDPPRHTG